MTREVPRSSYILRYFLPYPPYVDEETAGRRLEELLAFCRRTDVEAVMFYCNLLTDWYYMPDTPEHALKVAEDMKDVARRVRQAGFSFQLNLQDLVGALTGQADLRSLYDWECMVDHRGVEVKGVACPLSVKFRQTMGRQLAAWAATEPDILWIDDDLRLHNHLADGYADFYCFCPHHLSKFAERMGENLGREEILAGINRPGEPSDMRKAWLAFMNWTVVDTANWIQREVHRVSPRTRIAQMASIPDVHAAEGRDWDAFLRALSGEHPAIIRPHFGPYAEKTSGEFVDCYLLVDQLRKNIEMQHGKDVEYCPELENTRFTTWSKSAAATRFQLRLGQFLGCPGITLSLYDLEGSALSDEPAYESLLAKEKPFLDTLAALRLKDWTQCGVGLITDPLLGLKTQVGPTAAGSGPEQLMGRGRTFDRILTQMGVPTCYISPEEACGERVVAIDGTSAWLLDDEQVRRVLSGAAILDANAAEILVSRGFGDLIGIEEVQPRHSSTSAEAFFGDVIPGVEVGRTPLRMKKGMWKNLRVQQAARIVSEIIDPGGNRTPGTVCFENPQGGRIATYAGCVDVGVEFLSHRRIQWVTALLEWLARERFPVVHSARQRCLMIRRDCGDQVLLAYANLATDPMTRIDCRIRLGREVRQARTLGSGGQWKPLRAGWLRRVGDGEWLVRARPALPVYDWFVVLLDLEAGRSVPQETSRQEGPLS